ncbi:MAG: hypothetical protein Q9171_005330 [Xanthocarpia ochracea]
MKRSRNNLPAHLPPPKRRGENNEAQESSLGPVQSSPKPTTYRVQDLPGECSWDGTRKLLEAAFGFSEGQSDIKIRSLAYSSGHSGLKTATISSAVLAEILDEKINHWAFELLDHAQTTADGQSRPQFIILDSHFEGLTPLNSPNQQDHHLDVVALTGLGGHAFTSFKQREQDFMWLRDTLPDDLPGAQVWTYGSPIFEVQKASSFIKAPIHWIKQLADGVWSMTGPLSVLVDAPSATHGRPGEDQAHHIQALNRSHSDLVKYSRKDPEYGVVLSFLKEFAESASDIIRARFSIERDTSKNRRSLFGNSKDDRQSRAISKWLAPAAYECGHYQDDFEDARSLRYADTCRWIEARPEFVKWSSCKAEASQSLLWIHAIPGAGKTVLASYLVEFLEKPDNVHMQPQPIFYFFCKNADIDKNNALAITKALAHQLLQSPQVAGPDILKDLRSQMDSGGRSRAINFRPLFELISQHLGNLSRAIIIIDAADECSDIDQLLPGLIRLTEKGTAKVVLTSRREPNLVNILQNKPGLDMGPEDVQEDIRCYLEHQVSQSQVLSDARVRHRIIRILNIRSKGMFLWVALMIKELELCSTVENIEYTLDRLPDGLNEVYERILTRLHDSLKPFRKTFCCRLLKWITLAKRPLRLTEVGEALRIQYETAIDDFGNTQHLLCSTRELELVCGSLVTVKDGIIQLIHLSTKEFLIDQERASNLRQDFHAFFVRIQDDSALLSGICVMYLSTCCIPENFSRNISTKGRQTNGTKLFEYAYLNWILHLTESSLQTLVKQEPILQRFLSSRNSFYWLEICFTMQRGILSDLNTQLQSVLDWCSVHESQGSASGSLKDLVSLLHFWAKSYLHLLDDYGPSLEDRPYEVHDIDPERIFEPSNFRILESFRQSGSYHLHHVLKDAPIRGIPTNFPSQRVLQRYTGAIEEYGFFFVDERRKVFFMLDRMVTTAPRIYCQEMATGRRLTPVIDTEFADNNDFLDFKGATLSACGRYMGTMYSWYDNVGTTIYTAIWQLSEHLDFSGPKSPLWARKIISLSMPRCSTEIRSENPIAFGDDGYAYCTHGRVNLVSGAQELAFGACDSRKPLDLTFSGDGRSAVLFKYEARDIADVSPEGKLTSIYSYETGSTASSVTLSYSGRFLVWTHSFFATQARRRYIYDKDYCTIKELDAPLKGTRFDEINTRYLFTKDEQTLLFVGNNRVIIWRQYNSSFCYWAQKTIRGGLLGFCLDESYKHLYIVAEGRTWSRIDLNSDDLPNLDSELDEREITRTKFGISGDGTRMIILRQQFET